MEELVPEKVNIVQSFGPSFRRLPGTILSSSFHHMWVLRSVSDHVGHFNEKSKRLRNFLANIGRYAPTPTCGAHKVPVIFCFYVSGPIIRKIKRQALTVRTIKIQKIRNLCATHSVS